MAKVGMVYKVLSRSLKEHGKDICPLKYSSLFPTIEECTTVIEDKVKVTITKNGVMYVDAEDQISLFFNIEEATEYILEILDNMSIEEKEPERTE